MKGRWENAPRRVLWVATGVMFGLGMTILPLLQDDPVGRNPVRAIVLGAVAGVVFGGFISLWAVRQRDGARAAMGDVDGNRRAQAMKASTKGPIPQDPAVRSAAASLVAHRLRLFTRQRRWAVPFMAMMDILYVVLAVTQSPWWWFAALLFTAWLVASFVQPRLMARRYQALLDPPPVAAGERPSTGDTG